MSCFIPSMKLKPKKSNPFQFMVSKDPVIFTYWRNIQDWYNKKVKNSFFFFFCFDTECFHQKGKRCLQLLKPIIALQLMVSISLILSVTYCSPTCNIFVCATSWRRSNPNILIDQCPIIVCSRRKYDRVQDSHDEKEFWMTRLDWVGIILNQFEMFEEHENCLSRWKKCCSRWKQCWRKENHALIEKVRAQISQLSYTVVTISIWSS